MDVLSQNHVGNGGIRGFDDFQSRKHALLQQRLRQSLPFSLTEREALWWCYRCRTVWHERGRKETSLHLRSSQVQSMARVLHIDEADLEQLPQALCPACAVTHLGGIPRFEEQQAGGGYRFTWERVSSPALFLCIVSGGSQLSPVDTLGEVLSLPFDLPLAPASQIRQVLQWLSTASDPAWDVTLPLSCAHRDQLGKYAVPPSGLAWCGYGWPCAQSPPGPVLLVQAAMVPLNASFSAELLLACWRQIARGMAYLL